jgi:glycosidase
VQHVTPGLRFSQRGLFGLFLLLSLLLSGCGGGGTESVDDSSGPAGGAMPQSVSVVPASLALSEGESWSLRAVGHYADGTTKTLSGVSWRSESDAVATVSPTGRVTAIADGTVDITAELTPELSAGSIITVIAPGNAVTDLIANPAIIDMKVGDVKSLSLTAKYANGIQQNVATQATWEYTDATKVLITDDGRVEAIAMGAVTLTARFGGKSETILVRIAANDQATLSSVVITGAKAMAVGESLTLGMRATYSDGTSRTVNSGITWRSSNNNRATVSGGVVKAIAAGDVDITAEYQTKKISTKIGITAVSSGSGITVHFQKPANWTSAYIHYWSVLPAAAGIADTTWPGKPMQDLGGGWYSASFPKATQANVIFSDKGTPQSANLVRTASGWYVMDETRWYDKDPRTGVNVSANPAGGSFTTDGIDVTLKISGAGTITARYTLGGSDPALVGTAYSDGDKVTVGKGATVGQKFVLRLHATNGTDASEQRYEFEKIDMPKAENAAKQLRIYQVMVEAFQDGDPNRNIGNAWGPSHHRGDLRGIINALDYIKGLNMNAIWMTPIFESNGNTDNDGTGYFAYDYSKVDNDFGSDQDLRELIEKAHAKGMYVFLDGVFGHHKAGGVAPFGKDKLRPKSMASGPNRDNVVYDMDNSDNESVAFFKAVARYWIENYGIDGWRLDQAQEVPVKYWAAIRGEAQQACDARKQAGEQWGTLCYMVGEVLGSEEDIAATAYGTEVSPGLPSAFDVQGRYRVVQTLAVQECVAHDPQKRCDDPTTVQNPSWRGSAERLRTIYDTWRVYPSFAMPNLMISNHDYVRFGDLIQRAGLPGPESKEYWQRHKAALSYMAAYSGPITLYYNDEIGAEMPGFAARLDKNTCGTIHRCDDHVARTSGKIRGLSGDEQDLYNYTAAMMDLRAKYPVIAEGNTRNVLANGSLYADYKSSGGNRVLYVLNLATQEGTAQIDASKIGNATRLSGIAGSTATINVNASQFAVKVPPLTGVFFTVE